LCGKDSFFGKLLYEIRQIFDIKPSKLHACPEALREVEQRYPVNAEAGGVRSTSVYTDRVAFERGHAQIFKNKSMVYIQFLECFFVVYDL
jgi:hypothetical protein